jgi:GDSL-like Lipase/Acylhydrolase family
MSRPTSPTPPLALALLLAWGLAPTGLAPGWTGRVREALRSDLRNAADTGRMERGYYEALADAGRRLDQPASAEGSPTDFGPLTRPVADVREYVLKPEVSTTHRGASWSTNARGMRDDDYPIDKPANTYRIALAGDSIGAGWGVDDGRGFEPTWERTLGARSRASGGPSVEVLNHAVPGHAPGQRWEHFRREGWRSSPDLVLFQGTPADFGWDDRKLRSLLPRGSGWDAPSYREGLARSGARPGGDEESYKKALRPHREAMLAGVYRTVVDDCRARGVPSVWLLLPRVGKPVLPADRDRLVGLARSAGFSAIVDLSDAFDGLDPASLAIGPDDFHPNVDGHARLAERIDRKLREFLNIHRAESGPGGDRR